MPRKPIDYSKTIIYKFICKDLSVKDLYVGHTTNWIKRKASHKFDCNNTNSKSYNYKVYKMIREYGSWDNWEMVEVEKYPCNDEREASARERYWYEELYASMNTHRPLRTEEEEEEERKKAKKKYKDKNKKILSQKAKQKITCFCGSEIRKDSKSRHERTSKHKKYIEAVSVIQRVEEILNQDVNTP